MNTAETVKLLEAGTGYDIQPVTPMSLIEMAVGQGADVEKLSKLLDLQMRWEANEQRKAYHAAMAAFKAEAPQIVKNKTASFDSKRTGGNVSYEYATLDNVCDKLIPALSKHGLSHKWRTSQVEGGKVRVTCVISHSLGHSEDGATLEAPPDDSGTKNPVQAIGSTTWYLCRYTFLATAGVAVKGQDTDGIAFTPQLEQELRAIREAPDLSALKMVSTQPIQDYMKSNKLKEAKVLIDARDEAKKKLLEDEPA